MAALVERGIEKNRLEAKGLGGREPLVPHTDEANRWKNRRVEFILMR
jgi:outer membrane protein OmpA-like peptidoglycan-associated protein